MVGKYLGGKPEIWILRFGKGLVGYVVTEEIGEESPLQFRWLNDGLVVYTTRKVEAMGLGKYEVEQVVKRALALRPESDFWAVVVHPAKGARELSFSFFSQKL